MLKSPQLVQGVHEAEERTRRWRQAQLAHSRRTEAAAALFAGQQLQAFQYLVEPDSPAPSFEGWAFSSTQLLEAAQRESTLAKSSFPRAQVCKALAGVLQHLDLFLSEWRVYHDQRSRVGTRLNALKRSMAGWRERVQVWRSLCEQKQRMLLQVSAMTSA